MTNENNRRQQDCKITVNVFKDSSKDLHGYVLDFPNNEGGGFCLAGVPDYRTGLSAKNAGLDVCDKIEQWAKAKYGK